jgi:hypothetical protein
MLNEKREREKQNNKKNKIWVMKQPTKQQYNTENTTLKNEPRILLYPHKAKQHLSKLKRLVSQLSLTLLHLPVFKEIWETYKA